MIIALTLHGLNAVVKDGLEKLVVLLAMTVQLKMITILGVHLKTFVLLLNMVNVVGLTVMETHGQQINNVVLIPSIVLM
jgi:hypothetical protein